MEGVEFVNQITLHQDFTATTLLHPATYLNKIIVGSSQGSMQLWNTRTWYVPAIFQARPAGGMWDWARTDEAVN